MIKELQWKRHGSILVETNLVDGRKHSPRELFEEAKTKNYASIDCIIGNDFTRVAGVVYDKDFFGGSFAKGKPDIGAAEYRTKKPEKPQPPEAVLLEGISVRKHRRRRSI